MTPEEEARFLEAQARSRTAAARDEFSSEVTGREIAEAKEIRRERNRRLREDTYDALTYTPRRRFGE